ncbi:cytidine and deoxycytidylate deaminase domain containing protein [Xanthomonas phage DES1]|nr:cytidine and deoxycytidylate deaminase domain containing protein [Xanthomonas phage DES1]
MARQYAITALAYNKRGRLLSVGQNSYTKTHRLQAELGKLSGRPKAIYLHAELAALLKAREPVHKLVVTRYDKDGNPANSAPCPACQLAIKKFNVKIVEHT